jgi:hypothetical protein
VPRFVCTILAAAVSIIAYAVYRMTVLRGEPARWPGSVVQYPHSSDHVQGAACASRNCGNAAREHPIKTQCASTHELGWVETLVQVTDVVPQTCQCRVAEPNVALRPLAHAIARRNIRGTSTCRRLAARYSGVAIPEQVETSGVRHQLECGAAACQWPGSGC